MISARTRVSPGLAVVIVFAFRGVAPKFAASADSQLVRRELRAENFAGNKIGVSPVRKMVIFLPPGYDRSAQRYPVIYFLANAFDGYRSPFDQQGAQGLFDPAIASGVIGKFILVSVDRNTPFGDSWYVNSPVTGKWQDFRTAELVPYIDANFRTLPHRHSRGVAGDRMGGAKSLDDLKGDVFSAVFTSIFQAHLPNPDKPPLFFDMPAHKVGDQLVVDSKVAERLHNNFFSKE